jgi:hypothetical protein
MKNADAGAGDTGRLHVRRRKKPRGRISARGAIAVGDCESSFSLSEDRDPCSAPALAMSTRKSSSGTLTAPTDPSPEDSGPSSEVRPFGKAAEAALATATLVVVTSLRGSAAEAAWVTVTRTDGVVSFEGPLEADGCVAIALSIAPGSSRVCIRLETLRWHRQAEIGLRPGSNAYAFS